jgi:microcystin-dependent protein
MSNLTQQPIWRPDVNQIDAGNPVNAAVANAAPQALADRTLYLYEQALAGGALGTSAQYSASLNDLRKAGTFRVLVAATEKPSAESGHCFVSSAGVGGAASVLQMFFDVAGGVYFRRFNSSAWSAWAEFLTTLSLDATPAGSLIHFAGATTPAGYLKCQGQLLSRTVYARLFLAIGVLYGSGDGTSTFAVPDGRGRFLRQLDEGAGRDPDRVLGSSQGDSFASHEHDYQESNISDNGGAGSVNNVNIGNSTRATQSTGGTETRPKNIAVNLLIRF